MSDSKIEVKMQHVKGAFDMDYDNIVCIASKKHATVTLAFEANMHIPFAEIRLYESGLLVDAAACFDAAQRLGNQIATRFNKCRPW